MRKKLAPRSLSLQLNMLLNAKNIQYILAKARSSWSSKVLAITFIGLRSVLRCKSWEQFLYETERCEAIVSYP